MSIWLASTDNVLKSIKLEAVLLQRNEARDCVAASIENLGQMLAGTGRSALTTSPSV